MLFPFIGFEIIKILPPNLNYQDGWILRFLFLFLGVLFLGFVYRLGGRLTALVLLISPVFIYLFSALNLLLIFTQKNNSSLFSDMGLTNGINIFRGQGIAMGANPMYIRLLLNKSYFLLVGMLHWLTEIGPAKLFGQFDGEGIWGPSGMGMFPKVFVIPMFLGLIKGLKTKRVYISLLIVLALTFPVAFLYPQAGYKFLVLAMPFWAIIISVGFQFLVGYGKIAVLFLAIGETLITFALGTYEAKVTNVTRPSWIEPIITEARVAGSKEVFVSDDLTDQLSVYLRWYEAETVNIIDSSSQIFRCTNDEAGIVIVGLRDLAIIKRNISNVGVAKTFYDARGQEVAFRMKPEICVK